MSSVIVTRPDLPEAAFELLRIAFPEDEDDPRTFWPPDSVHALEYKGDKLVAHAGFLERTLHLRDRDIVTAYVEYVAAEPRNSGHGTTVMKALTEEIKRRAYKLAALGTGSHAFYSRLGWKPWRGPTGYRKDGRVYDMPMEENPMVLDFGANINLDDRIDSDWREGDIW